MYLVLFVIERCQNNTEKISKIFSKCIDKDSASWYNKDDKKN
jgi:hypothetical protein